jgi:hypothetical protein
VQKDKNDNPNKKQTNKEGNKTRNTEKITTSPQLLKKQPKTTNACKEEILRRYAHHHLPKIQEVAEAVKRSCNTTPSRRKRRQRRRRLPTHEGAGQVFTWQTKGNWRPRQHPQQGKL